VGGSFDEAPDRAFRPLARFVDGANRSRRQIAMTVPVTQQKAGWEHPEKIATTAPVVQQTAGRPGWRRGRRLRPRRSPARAWIQPGPRLQNSKLAVLGSPTSSSAGRRQTPSPPTPCARVRPHHCRGEDLGCDALADDPSPAPYAVRHQGRCGRGLVRVHGPPTRHWTGLAGSYPARGTNRVQSRVIRLDKARRFWELASQLTGLDAT
jgi:hypothetical protein